jgi:hypothetical protein
MAQNGVPIKYRNPGDDKSAAIEKKLETINDQLNPFSAEAKNIGKKPFYSTGARALVRVAGKPVGVCTSISWNVQYNAEPINTIDTPHAWDIDIGQVRITANLSKFMDPTGGLEAEAMAHIMPAAIHQPMVEMQVLDGFGTSLFFARGVFATMSGNISRGQISTFSASFVGTVYQHYVSQTFKPYSVAAKVSGALNNLTNLAGNLTGGLL